MCWEQLQRGAFSQCQCETVHPNIYHNFTSIHAERFFFPLLLCLLTAQTPNVLAQSYVSILGTFDCSSKNFTKKRVWLVSFCKCCGTSVGKKKSNTHTHTQALCGVFCCSDEKQWTSLCREQGLESEGDSDTKPRYKTNDHEIQLQLMQPACSLCASVCVCVCVCGEALDSVCQGSVMITDCGPQRCFAEEI